tara:strand:+ start:75 stop:542 length:468 start_codon:yes stop_codon:yes gene_type:complete
MISSNQYQDIELQQNADFTNVITLDSSYTMTSDMKYAAVIVKDYKHSAFTGPGKTGNGVNGTPADNDQWASGNQNEVHFDVVANRAAKTITLTLPAEAIQHFNDDFEGHWDLVEKNDLTNDKWVRHIQGDVIISKGATKLTHTFTASVSGIGGGG